MILIARLTTRMVARGLDRSTGSPLTRYLLVSIALILPVLLIRASQEPDQVLRNSDADLVNAYIVAAATSVLVTLPVALIWQIDRRLLEVFAVSPMQEGRWQLGLLGPWLIVALWLSLSAASPLLFAVLLDPTVASPMRVIALAVCLQLALFGALAGMVVGLSVRFLLQALPASARSIGRSIALIGMVGLVLTASTQGWEVVNAAIARREIGTRTEGDALASLDPVVGVVTLLLFGGGLVAIPLLAWLVMALPFAAEGPEGSASRRLRLPVRADPRVLGASCWRSAASPTQLMAAAVAVAVGLAMDGWSWLAHGGLFLAATTFVGYSPGNVGMRDAVRVGARSPVRWFLSNGAGALATWLAIVGVWQLCMSLFREASWESAAAASIVMAIALAAGGLFAESYHSAIGAEMANLVVYLGAAAAVLAIIQWQLFAYSAPLVAGLTATIVGAGLVAYCWQHVEGCRRGAS